MRREDLPKVGDIIFLTMPTQPLPGATLGPTALQMRVDLIKAKIAAVTEEIYNPTQLEYERRLRESAQYRNSLASRR